MNKPISVNCALCTSVAKYRGLNSPFDWDNPIARTVDSTSGILLSVKGSTPVSRYIEEQCSAGKKAKDATLAELDLSTPQLDLSAELKPFWQVDA